MFTKSFCPTERVSEIKRGKKTETTRKFFPGYLIVNMWLLDDNKGLVDKTWYFIKDTSGRDWICRDERSSDRHAPERSRRSSGAGP